VHHAGLTESATAQVRSSRRTGSIGGHQCRSVDVRNEYATLQGELLLLRYRRLACCLVLPEHAGVLRRLLILPLWNDLFAAQHHLLEEEDMIVARLVGFRHGKMVIEPEVTKLVKLVALPILNPVHELADSGLLRLEVGHLIDASGNTLDSRMTFLKLGAKRVSMLGCGMQNSLI